MQQAAILFTFTSKLIKYVLKFCSFCLDTVYHLFENSTELSEIQKLEHFDQIWQRIFEIFKNAHKMFFALGQHGKVWILVKLKSKRGDEKSFSNKQRRFNP